MPDPAALLAEEMIRFVRARRRITLADIMRKFGIDMRLAYRLLRAGTEAGALVRTGGTRTEPFRWHVARIEGEPAPVPARQPRPARAPKAAAMPKELPPPTMQERAEAARSARAMRSALWDKTAMGEELTAHIDYSRPRRAEWLTTWGNLPGFKRVNGRFQHTLLPGWQYERAEVEAEMIPDLEALAERGVRPTEATQGLGGV